MHRLYKRYRTPGESFGLLVLRVIVGAAFVLHGWPKIQNPMNWMGDGVHPFLQLGAAVSEFGGGIALILGLLTPLAVLGIAGVMIGALALVHFPKGDVFVASGGGGNFELPLVYLGVMIALLATGPGRYSLDATLWGRPSPVFVEEREAWKKTAAA